MKTGQGLASMLPVMDGRLLALLLGKGGSAPLPAGMTLYAPEPGETEAGAEEAGAEEAGADETGAVGILLRRRDSMPAETVVLWGPEGSGKRDTARAFADRTGQGLVF